MTNEQKEAIEICKEKIIEPFYAFPNPTSIELKDKDVRAIEMVLSLIKEQQEEIEKYEKIIDKISQNPFNELRVDGIRFCGGDIKQYFERKVEDVKD